MTAAAVYAPVRHLMLEVTRDCNLRCSYCFVDKKPYRMTRETALQAVEFLFSRNISGCLNETSITFFGGEPFLELELIEQVATHARKRGRNLYKRAALSATTNGTIATDRVERLVRDHRMRLLVSLDGGQRASAHRPFTSGRPSHDAVARNLGRLVSWSPDAVVRMTYHPGALALVDNVRHALELGAPSVALCPVDEADWSGAEAALDESWQAMADWYLAEARQGRMLPLELTHRMLVGLHAVRQGGTRQTRPCGVGTALLGIDVAGNVMPCHRFLYRPQDWLGRVDHAQLAPERGEYVSLRTSEIQGCDTCAAASVCGGGCRAVVVAAGLDIRSGRHPGYCLTTRAHHRAAQRIYDTLISEDNKAFLQALQSPRSLPPGLAELAFF